MKSSNKSWVKVVARIGYSAKCVVYCVLGVLIFYAAFTAAKTENISKKSAFQEILASPFGVITLSAVVFGFACYVLWRVVQGITNPGNLDMTKPTQVMTRIFYFFSAIAYTSATYVAAKVLLGISSEEGNKKEQIGNSIMQQTWGVVLVGMISLLIMVFAVIQFKHALKGDFMDKFVNSMSLLEKKMVNVVGRLGFAGRGVVYTMAGGFFMHAAATQNSDKAGGLAQALSTLLEQPFGPWMVGLVSCGMISFGIFCGFEGKYRQA